MLPAVLLDQVIEQFTEKWDRGERVRAEEYVGPFAPSEAAELVYHEFCLAEAADLNPDPAEYLQRFPDYSEALSRLLSLHGALSISTLQRMVEPTDLPESGDAIGPYRLLRELGRGAFARVFLAEQSDLGDRLTVVKVSTRPSTEPTLLARARHANIVEVLRHVDANDGALHLVCLPFLGGATLSAILEDRRRKFRRGQSRNRPPRSGRAFLDDLDHASAPEYPSTSLPRPAREVMARLSYPKALAWLIARLAEALDHAQRRGVTHGDIKPSNILITADGTPMLFDFNLAIDWHDAEALDPGADLGGTLAYMAPERLRAIAEPDSADDQASRRRPPDRHRADLYALGLVLAEALTGEPPEVPDRKGNHPRSFASELAQLRGGSAASQLFPYPKRIPPTLQSILAKCLAPDPSDRYARGGELAEDLDRWRSDRPLVYADEPTWSAWVRQVRQFRYPILAVALTVMVASVVGLGASVVMEGTRRDQALAKLSYILDKTEDVFRPIKFGHWRPDSTVDPVDLAHRHLAHYEVVTDPNWRDRPDIRALPDRERGELVAWLLEQVLRRAVALGDRPNSPDDWQRALSLLDREIAIAPFSAFQEQRSVLRERLALTQRESAHFAGVATTQALEPEPWLEAYLAGVAAEPLNARRALSFYLDALATRPDFFWAHYRLAGVACRLNEYSLASQSLRECVSRLNNPALHTLRASTIYLDGRYAPPGSSLANLDEAEAECERALALNPDLAEANRVRTLIHKISGRAEGVRADIERFSLLTALRNPTESVLLRITSRNLPGEKVGLIDANEEASLRRAIADDPDNEQHKATLADRLVIAHRKAEAVELYDQVIASNPAHLNARYQRGIELARMSDPESTAEFVSLVDHPRFEELYRDRSDAYRAFHYIAEQYLKEGRHVEAEVMVERALKAIGQSKALSDQTIKARNNSKPGIHPRGENSYNFARVNVVAARSDPSRLAIAVAHLKDAFAASPVFRTQWFAGDPLFDLNRAEILKQIDDGRNSR